jgi:hypothetical protein
MTTSDDFPNYDSQESASDNAALFGEPSPPPPVFVSYAPWYMPRLGNLQMAFNTWMNNFEQEVTGLGIVETRFNLNRLVCDACENLTMPKGDLMFPKIGTFRHTLLANRRQYLDAMRLADIAIEVAEAVRPDLVDEGDEARLNDLARSYCHHVSTTESTSFSTVRFAYVLMPTKGFKPSVTIDSNDDLPEILARYQASVGN